MTPLFFHTFARLTARTNNNHGLAIIHEQALEALR